MSGRVWRLGIIGCGWVGGVHARAAKTLPNANVTACCARRQESAERFAGEHGIGAACADHRDLVAREDVDVVIVGSPNHLHHRQVLDALDAGKHVIVEKPLAISLEQCEEIVARAHEAGLMVGYAEELCFVPKFVRVRELCRAGAIGDVRFIKQVEKHEGPHARWFYERETAGGGVAMDMLCHSIELARWLVEKPAVTSVWSDMRTWLHTGELHADVTELEDHALCHLAFEGGATALLESSWTLRGGMSSSLEVHGTEGVLHAELLGSGMGLKLFSQGGSEREEVPAGWSFPDVDWLHQNGYPQELAHFLACCEGGIPPEESAEDGLAVMELLLACYYSAGTGANVDLPFLPRGVGRPVDLWKEPPLELSL